MSNNQHNVKTNQLKLRYRSISLNSNKPSKNGFNYMFSNFSPKNGPSKKILEKSFSNLINEKKNKVDSFFYSTLPKVSIDLNETSVLKVEEVTQMIQKMNELNNEKIKFLNKAYIKELKILKDTIDLTILNNCISTSSSNNNNSISSNMSSNLSSSSAVNN